jgi:hypothetical protein
MVCRSSSANRHIKDKAKDHYKGNLLTVMQVFGNANGLFIRKLISKTV